MEILKQKRIGGKTYELRRERTNRSGKQYAYYVTENGKRVDDPVYSRKEGREEWSATIQHIRRAEGEDRNEARSPGFSFGIAGGDRAPDFRVGFDPDDDSDDDGLGDFRLF